jgi:hypothetical protein
LCDDLWRKYVGITTFTHDFVAAFQQEKENERRTQSCNSQGFSAFPNLGHENSERLLLREGAITRIPASLCGNPGAKDVILIIGDGMGWEMARAGSIAKQVVAELKGLGCSIEAGCPGNLAAINQFTGRTLDNYYTEGTLLFLPIINDAF